MSEEAVAAEAEAPETPVAEAPTIPSTEESLSALDAEMQPEPSDDTGFLDFIGDALEGGSETTEPETEPETAPETTEETTSPDTEEESPATDLVDDFPSPEELSETLDEKAVAKWGELRSELAEARARAAELEGQITETPVTEGTEQLEQQLYAQQEAIEAYERELSISRVETSAEYKRTVAEPLQSIMDATEALAERNEKDPGVLLDILSESNIERQNKNLEEVAAEMGDRDKMMLYRMVDDAQAIFERDRQLKEYAAEAAAELDHHQQQEEEKALHDYTMSTKSSVNKVYDKFESVLPELDGTDLGELRKKTLEDNFLDLGVDHQAYAVSAGTLLPPMVKALRAKDAKIASLEKQLSSYQKATPKAAESGGGVQVAPSEPSSSEGFDFMDAISKRLGV